MEKEPKSLNFTEHLPQAIWDTVVFFGQTMVKHWPWTLLLFTMIALKVYVDRRFPDRKRRRGRNGGR